MRSCAQSCLGPVHLPVRRRRRCLNLTTKDDSHKVEIGGGQAARSAYRGKDVAANPLRSGQRFSN